MGGCGSKPEVNYNVLTFRASRPFPEIDTLKQGSRGSGHSQFSQAAFASTSQTATWAPRTVYAAPQPIAVPVDDVLIPPDFYIHPKYLERLFSGEELFFEKLNLKVRYEIDFNVIRICGYDCNYKGYFNVKNIWVGNENPFSDILENQEGKNFLQKLKRIGFLLDVDFNKLPRKISLPQLVNHKTLRHVLIDCGLIAKADLNQLTVLDRIRNQERSLKAEDFFLEKASGQLGTNPGGFYRGKNVDGANVERYIKAYKYPLQAYCEELATEIYRSLGLHAPLCISFTHNGCTYLSSRKIENTLTWQQYLNKNPEMMEIKTAAEKFLQGFLADVLIKNWDAIGAGCENPKANVLVGNDGEICRIDAGGTFFMRGLSGKKPDESLHEIDELEKFFDDSVNPSYKSLAAFANIHSAKEIPNIREQMDAILGLRAVYNGWEGFINKVCPDKFTPSEQLKVVTMLEIRTHKLQLWVEMNFPGCVELDESQYSNSLEQHLKNEMALFCKKIETSRSCIMSPYHLIDKFYNLYRLYCEDPIGMKQKFLWIDKIKNFEGFFDHFCPGVGNYSKSQVIRNIDGFKRSKIDPGVVSGDDRKLLYYGNGDRKWVRLPRFFVGQEIIDELRLLKKEGIPQGKNHLYHDTGSAALENIGIARAILSAANANEAGIKINTGEYVSLVKFDGRPSHCGMEGLSDVYTSHSGLTRGAYTLERWFNEFPMTFCIGLKKQQEFNEEKGINRNYEDFVGEGIEVGPSVPLEHVIAISAPKSHEKTINEWIKNYCPWVRFISKEAAKAYGDIRYLDVLDKISMQK